MSEAKRVKLDGAAIASVTCTAPVNIAVIKYWGKRDSKLLLPINSSLSATLHQDQLHAKTSVATSSTFTADRMWLNGVEEPITNKRLQNVLAEIRARAAAANPKDGRVSEKVHICSENNFPTAAGLASSAAGYACLVASLANYFGVQNTELSSIARVGSGSACRSVYGGWVRWTMGVEADGSDSIASQVAPAEHWPEVQILILVVNTGKKGTSSTSGMETSVQTSELLAHRAKVVVPARMEAIEAAIQAKDFNTFGEITIKDSNQFHACCLDTYPPIFYLNDNSRHIIQLMSRYNAYHGTVKAAYTFDAGPNAVIYCLKDDVPEILGLVKQYLPNETPPADGEGFYRGLSSEEPASVSAELIEKINMPSVTDGIRYVLHTEPGPGPIVTEDTLLGADGLPKRTV